MKLLLCTEFLFPNEVSLYKRVYSGEAKNSNYSLISLIVKSLSNILKYVLNYSFIQNHTQRKIDAHDICSKITDLPIEAVQTLMYDQSVPNSEAQSH
jgi:hypothetical protein